MINIFKRYLSILSLILCICVIIAIAANASTKVNANSLQEDNSKSSKINADNLVEDTGAVMKIKPIVNGLKEDNREKSKKVVVENLVEDTDIHEKSNSHSVKGLVGTLGDVAKIYSSAVNGEWTWLEEDEFTALYGNTEPMKYWSIEEYEDYTNALYNSWSSLVAEGRASQKEIDEIYVLLLENLKLLKDGYTITKPIVYEDGRTLVGEFKPIK